MRDIFTPLFNGLKSPFIGDQTPDPSHEASKSHIPEHKSSLANLKSQFIGQKPSFGIFKRPFLGHKISIPFIRGLKSPFPGGNAPESSVNKAKSTFPGLSIFKRLTTPFIGSKDPKATTAPIPVPVPVPVPIPERQHIPPYHHLVDYEIGYYDNGDALDAFKTSLPNLPKGYRYREIVRVPGFGDPHLLGLPINVRFRIYQFVTASVRAKNKMVVLSPNRTIDGFWPKKHFMEPQTVFKIIGSLSLSCVQLRHEIMTYYCSQFHFHVTYNCFCTPLSAPIILKWLPLFANRMQFLTVEVDFTRLGGCYKNDKFALKHGVKEMQWFMKNLVKALSDRSGTIRSLHIMCRRYKGFRPPSQKYIPEENIPDNTEPPEDGTPQDEAPQDETPEDESKDGSENGTSEVRTSINSSVIVGLSHGEDTSNTDGSSTKKDKPYKNVPIKYCSSYTTTVLDYLPRRLGRKGIPLYHFRLSGFGKPYTKRILKEVGLTGNGPTLLLTPKVPPWPRDYPEIEAGITTTDGDYLGTVVKFVNAKEETNAEKPRTSRMAASRAFFRKALSRIAFAMKRNKARLETSTPAFDYRELFSTFDDSDEESVQDIDPEYEDNPEGVGLGIQLPIVPRHPNNRYSLMRMYAIEQDILKQLEEPDLPREVAVELIEMWAIDSMSTRFGNLFGVSTATRGLPKDRRPPIVVNPVHKAFNTLFKRPQRLPARTPNIIVKMAAIPEIEEQLQEINATSSTLTGLFNSSEPRVPAAGQSQIQMNRTWNLGHEREDLSHLAQHNSSTISTFYTDASESTLDMGYSDPTIPAQLATMHEQEVDSSSTLCEPDDRSETPTMARISNEDPEQPEEVWDHGDEHQDDSLIALYAVSTSSTYDTDGTRSRSNTGGSEVLDWPLPNPTMLPPPTRPPPPVPEVGNQLHQIATVSSRRTLCFADEDQLHEIPTSSSRRAIQFSDEDGLHQIPTSSSRKTLRFDVPEESEAEQEARHARSDSFRQQRQAQRQAEKREHAERIQNLDSLFNYSATPPLPREPTEPKKQRSRSGSFWNNDKAKDDADDKPSQPTLRTAKSFPSSAYARDVHNDPEPAQRPNLNEKRSMSRLFHRKNKEQKDVKDVEEMSNNFDSLFSDPSADIPADIPADKGATGRLSRGGGFWKRNKGDAQPDAADETAPHPPLRSTRSFSFNPLRLRRRSSTLNTNATEVPDELLEEPSNEEFPNEVSNEPSHEPSEVPVPAAAAPTPEPRARSRGFFSLRRKKSMLRNAEEIDTMSSSLSLLFNDSSATIATNTNESNGRQSVTTTGRQSVASGRESAISGRESTAPEHQSSAFGRQSAASGRQSPAPSTGYNSFSRNLGRRGAAGGSIFGPNGGRKDGRGSLANIRWGEGAGFEAPTGLREVREARERREREEREKREIEEEMEREREIERRELEDLRERERRDRERRRDRGQLGLSRVVAPVDSDDEEGGYVV